MNSLLTAAIVFGIGSAIGGINNILFKRKVSFNKHLHAVSWLAIAISAILVVFHFFPESSVSGEYRNFYFSGAIAGVFIFWLSGYHLAFPKDKDKFIIDALEDCKNKLKISKLSILSDRQAIQRIIDRILDNSKNKPRDICQTFFNHNPTSTSGDILHKIDNKDCKVKRVIGITRPMDIFFAQHSLDMQYKNIVANIENKLFIYSEVEALNPMFPNITVLDDNTIISLPMQTGSIFRKVVNGGKIEKYSPEGISSGVYSRSREVAKAFNDYISRIGEKAFEGSIRKGHFEDNIIEAAKKIFWGDNISDRIAYLEGIASVIKIELLGQKSLNRNIVYIGIVGSIAKAIHEIRDGKENISDPNDLDVIIILSKMDPDSLSLSKDIIKKICETYSHDSITFYPTFSSSPAKHFHESRMPVHCIIQDEITINTMWETYIYLDRVNTRIDLYKEYPHIEHLIDYKMIDVINGEDGVIECIDTLKNKQSLGYEWSVINHHTVKSEVRISLDNDKMLFSFMRYSLDWALTNLKNANDTILSKNIGIDNYISLLNSMALNIKLENTILQFIMDKQYLDSDEIDVETCNSHVIEVLIEIKNWVMNFYK